MTKVIAELGINHNGDLATAKKMIDAAQAAQAWGVKFQYRNPEQIYASTAAEIGDEIVRANIIRSYIEPKSLVSLAEYARSIGLRVGTSFFTATDVADLEAFEFDFLKIPSAELTNVPLLDTVLESPVDVLVSTGMSSSDEIAWLNDRYGLNENLVVLHCVSNYPTDPSNAQLGVIEWLQNSFSWRVGYSSHDSDIGTALLALKYGPEFIERHLTLDKKLDGTDQSSSSEPAEFQRLVFFAKNYSQITSVQEEKSLNQGERINRQNLGRSLYLRRSVPRGTELSRQDFDYLSPQVGMNWMDWEEQVDRQVNQDLEQGIPLLRRHFGQYEHREAPRPVLDWARVNSVSLPVRLHDFEEIDSIFGLSAYEFHLSWSEAENIRQDLPIRAGSSYSVHLPDYVGPDTLLDPFSLDGGTRERSLALIEKVVTFSSRLSRESGNSVVVVCSFSNSQGTIDQFYKSVDSLFSKYSSAKVIMSLQWLPPVAWYFGGSVRLHRVNSPADLPFLHQYRIPITMDASHLLMGENAGMYGAERVLMDLEPLIVHHHVSGAAGVDGEGMDFDFTRASEAAVLDLVFRTAQHVNIAKVIEVWQGHLNNFSGFHDALSALEDRYSDV